MKVWKVAVASDDSLSELLLDGWEPWGVFQNTWGFVSYLLKKQVEKEDFEQDKLRLGRTF